MRDEKAVLAKYGQKKVALIVALLLASLLATGFVWAQKKVQILAVNFIL